MHRLFVAIRPPRPLRETLLAAMGGIANARWQTDEQLHLTLRFIGEVDRHQAEDIAAALGGVHHPRFSIGLDRAGQFDRKGRIDALWIGITPHDPLESLHKKVDRALTRVGIAPETRSFLPHITIARFGRSHGPIGSFFESVTVPPVSAEVSAFSLFESQLGNAGSSYSPIERYTLG